MQKRKAKRGAGARPRREGVLELTRKGVGYLPFDQKTTRGKEDIEIAPEDTGVALNGDTVEVEILSTRPRPRGRVVRVIARAREQFVGLIVRDEHGAWFLAPDDRRFPGRIRLQQSPLPFREGEKALVRLSEWKKGGEPMGEIVERLGKKSEHRVEMHAIILEHGFRTRFPEEALREADALAREHASLIAREAPSRMDFRAVPTCTIDPKDAKDFDDALSVRELPDGGFEVGVHIADVTHFVREGSALEEEAKHRGTSVYLVDATIPMLPEALSGDICSLREGEDRLTFSAVFTMSPEGEVRARRFGKSIIRSRKRFTYEEAQGVLDANEGPLHRELSILKRFGDILKEKRMKEGAIEFDQDEVKFELDAQGVPLKAYRKKRIPTMMMIEEWMLLANREVASFVHGLLKKVPERDRLFIYRIHDLPKADRIEELSVFLRAAGYDLGKKKALHARDFNALFGRIKGTPEESLIKTATIRSMAKAIYSTKNIGHFGLSFRYYTHFTSPIRRYPDMMVHRLLAGHLDGTPIGAKEFKEYERLALSSSEAEARAVSAERESIRYKQVEYLKKSVGKVFDGVISGVTEWGIYVEEPETRAEGLIRVRNLPGDYFVLDRTRYALVGTRSKRSFALGDTVRVRVASADLDLRELTFELA